MKVCIECNIVNDRKRYLCLYVGDKLSEYFVSAVPLSLEEERADKLIAYIEREREKLSGQHLLRFNAKIRYTKKLSVK